MSQWGNPAPKKRPAKKKPRKKSRKAKLVPRTDTLELVKLKVEWGVAYATLDGKYIINKRYGSLYYKIGKVRKTATGEQKVSHITHTPTLREAREFIEALPL